MIAIIILAILFWIFAFLIGHCLSEGEAIGAILFSFCFIMVVIGLLYLTLNPQ